MALAPRRTNLRRKQNFLPGIEDISKYSWGPPSPSLGGVEDQDKATSARREATGTEEVHLKLGLGPP